MYVVFPFMEEEVSTYYVHTLCAYLGRSSTRSSTKWPNPNPNPNPNQVEYAVKHEMAVTVKDMLSLRMRLAYINSEAAKQALLCTYHVPTMCLLGAYSVCLRCADYVLTMC